MAVSKPQRSPTLDTSHPLASDLTIAVLQVAEEELGGASDGDAINYGPTSGTMSATAEINGGGATNFTRITDPTYGLVLQSTGDEVIAFGTVNDNVIGTEDFTIISRVRAQSASAQFAALCGKGDVGAGEFMHNVLYDLSTERARIFSGGVLVEDTTTGTDNFWYDICATRRNGEISVYTRLASGSSFSSNSAADATNISDTAHFFSLFGADYDGTIDTGRTFVGEIDYFYVAIGTGLSQSQAVEVWNDPYSLYQQEGEVLHPAPPDIRIKEWTDLGNDEQGEAFTPPVGYVLRSIQFSGTYSSGTLAFQGSNESSPTNWATLASDTALGVLTPSGQAFAFRPAVVGGSGTTVTVTAYFEHG